MQLKSLREFIKLESSGGIVLFTAAVIAIIIDNSPWHIYYQRLFNEPMSFHIGAFSLSKPLLMWINDGFMTIFFLLVGLEIKREMLEGELSQFNKAMLPVIAAIGGMVVPALIYIFFNAGDKVALRGWAIPAATDIAFALGILSLLGKRLPVSLKLFLTAFAIIDDIGAIIIIAVFYTKHISLLSLFIASIMVLALVLLNRFRVRYLAPYLVVGFILWVSVLNSGVHATLAGIILAFTIPLRDDKHPKKSPLRYLEHLLHPWVAFAILPLFAFANAGVSFSGVTLSELFSSVPLGIAAGLFFGKQIGIWGATMLAVKLKISKMPKGASSLGIYGVSLIAGVGFTMSLFIGSLAFGHEAHYPAMVRMGVIMGSILSGVLGYFVLSLRYREQQPESSL